MIRYLGRHGTRCIARAVMVGATRPSGGDGRAQPPVRRVIAGRRAPERRDVEVGWSDSLRALGVPTHLVCHLTVMAKLHAQDRCERMADDLLKLIGTTPMRIYEFVKLHVTDFKRHDAERKLA
jgi:hypothetical protein